MFLLPVSVGRFWVAFPFLCPFFVSVVVSVSRSPFLFRGYPFRFQFTFFVLACVLRFPFSLLFCTQKKRGGWFQERGFLEKEPPFLKKGAFFEFQNPAKRKALKKKGACFKKGAKLAPPKKGANLGPFLGG